MQRRDVGLKVAGRKLRPAFLFLPQQLSQVFRLIGLGLIPQERPQLGIGPPVEVQTGGLLSIALFIAASMPPAAIWTTWYFSFLKLLILASRSTSILRVGVWTRPTVRVL